MNMEGRCCAKTCIKRPFICAFSLYLLNGTLRHCICNSHVSVLLLDVHSTVMLLGGDMEIVSVIHCQTRLNTLQSIPARNDTFVDALQVGNMCCAVLQSVSIDQAVCC